jgi:adenylate kinase
MKYRTILLFGAPGRQRHARQDSRHIPNFTAPAARVPFPDASSPLGKTFIEHSSRGQLVPDEPTVELWRSFIEGCVRSGRFQPRIDTLVLDGIPRNLHQAEMLADTLGVKAVFYMHCTNFESLVQRLQKRALKENRLDDANLDVIRDRIKDVRQGNQTRLNFYGKKVTHRIDSTPDAVKVLQDILRHVDKVG